MFGLWIAVVECLTHLFYGTGIRAKGKTKLEIIALFYKYVTLECKKNKIN